MSSPDVSFHKILRPVLTEKTLRLEQFGQYAFRVSKSATKKQVKDAIEAFFSVVVAHVRIAHMKRKNRNSRPKGAWKKAYVKLAPGGVITLNDQPKQSSKG
jgi:large subunit ribosomal protein L23